MKQNKKIRMSVIMILSVMVISILVFNNPVIALDTTTPITLSTISGHNTLTDCWTAISGKVYNITTYISSHPGGEAIGVICGIDGSTILDAQHSLAYASIIKNYQIGVLALPETTSPVITVLGTNPVNKNVGDVYTDAGATATDNIDGNLTESIITVSTVDTSIAGIYIVTYSVTDSSGNSANESRTVIVSPVIVEDTTVPVITVLGSNTVNKNVGDVYTDVGATATDDIDGNLTSSIITNNPVDTTIAGTYIVTYSVTDSSGNSANASRTVIVNPLTNQTNGGNNGNESQNQSQEDHENENDSNDDHEKENETHVKQNLTNHEKQDTDKKNHEKENKTHVNQNNSRKNHQNENNVNPGLDKQKNHAKNRKHEDD